MAKTPDKFNFPSGFLWGSATSAHQVEGGNFNDWSEYEINNAENNIKKANKKEWSNFILENYPSPFDRENYISGRVCDSYNQYEKDFDLAKKLGQNAHRFSIEWSRIEPEEGNFNQKEIEHYKNVILALKARGLEPFITLHHFTNPIWFVKRGGWENKDSPKYFARYAQKIVQEFKDYVKFWVTINEPIIFISQGYIKGDWPPLKKNIFSAIKPLFNLIKAHKEVYQSIKRISGINSKVGIVHNMSYIEPYRNNLANKILSSMGSFIYNNYLLRKIKNFQDFIGLNYYNHTLVKISWSNSVRMFFCKGLKECTDMGWEIYPEGIYHVLKSLKKYQKPIYITENGLADAKDEKRAKFIVEHLRWINQAMREGVDVRGYFHWSLIDNFEWDKGFWPRFGLIEIDYKTMERKIRQSALVYEKICRENSLEIAVREQQAS